MDRVNGCEQVRGSVCVSVLSAWVRAGLRSGADWVTKGRARKREKRQYYI